MRTAIAMFLIVSLLAALTFAVRLACAPFSAKVSDEMSRHPVVHWSWGIFALFGGLLFFGILSPNWWPPASIERRGQRQKVVERVVAAGGWTALQKECDALVEQYRDSAFVWYRGNTNALPPTIAALKPWSVIFYSPTMMRGSKDEPQVPVIRIKIFGLHSTGGHSTPYFGLEVVSGTGAETYSPKPKRVASGNRYWRYTQVTDRIYEVY